MCGSALVVALLIRTARLLPSLDRIVVLFIVTGYLSIISLVLMCAAVNTQADGLSVCTGEGDETSFIVRSEVSVCVASMYIIVVNIVMLEIHCGSYHQALLCSVLYRLLLIEVTGGYLGVSKSSFKSLVMV